ncbi:hypothetical protein ACFWPA_17340 [Rhodococcus sp. NPDC058505]|uniref:hypothetical protein n=1 Tax=unclassified Rhodococcus (in: high G+C Gram-positive bacteria) TaxID=192944 RepID=UPI0036472246
MLTTDEPPRRRQARVTRFCRSGLTSVVSEMRREGAAETSVDLRAAVDLLDLGIGQMSTPTAALSHPFQVQPVVGAHVVHADVERSTMEPEVVHVTADLPADAPPGPVRVVWFNMLTLVGGMVTVETRPAPDDTYRVDETVRAGPGVVVAGIVLGRDGRPGFALVAE